MDGHRARQEAGEELIRQAARRLDSAWPDAVTVSEVLVAMPDRAVFRTLTPDGRAVIVKADLCGPRATAERSVTAAAHAAGLPVPGIVYADDGVPALLVLQYVAGPVLSSDAPASAWADAGATLRRVHNLPDPGCLPPVTDWRVYDSAAGQAAARRPLRETLPDIAARDAAAAAELGMLTARQAARLSDLLGGIFGTATEPDRYCVLHGDPQTGHFLLGDRSGTTAAGAAVAGATAAGSTPAGSTTAGSTASATTASATTAGAMAAGIAALIDFGEACTGDPAWDLAILTLDHPERLGYVLAGYAPGARLRGRLRRMIGPYRMLRWLGEANWLHEHGFSPDQPLAALAQSGTGDCSDTLSNY
jgi:aminoglycoside phosphotransferase